MAKMWYNIKVIFNNKFNFMREDSKGVVPPGEMGGEKAENKKSVPLAEILLAVEKRTYLTDKQREVLRELGPKIIDTANQLAEGRAS